MKTLTKSILAMLLLAAVLVMGCKKEAETENTDDSSTVSQKNPNPAQDTPLAEHFLPEFKDLFGLLPNLDGSFYAVAEGEHTDYLLKITIR